jgi:hypothetical protein
MSDTTKTAIETIRSLYNAATGSWTGADWAHYVRRNGRDTAVECDGATKCETCRDAKDSAMEAEDLAKAAMEAVAAGDLAKAARLAGEARGVEDQWGDAPTWADWASAVAELAVADDDDE